MRQRAHAPTVIVTCILLVGLGSQGATALEKAETAETPGDSSGATAPGKGRRPDDPVIREIVALVQRAVALQGKGNLAQAATAYQLAIAGARAALGDDSRDTATLRIRLGDLYRQMGKLDEAATLMSQALETLETQLGEDHAVVGAVLTKLGDVHWTAKRYQEALPLHERAAGILGKKLPRAHAAVCYAFNQLAATHHELGNFETALRLDLENWKIREASLGKDHLHVLLTLHNLGTSYHSLNRYDESLEMFNVWLERNARGHGGEHPDYGRIMEYLASNHAFLDHQEQAARYYLQAIECQRKTAKEDTLHTALLEKGLAQAYKTGYPSQLSEAEGHYRRAAEIIKKVTGANSFETADAMVDLGVSLMDLSRFDESESVLLEAVGVYEQQVPQNDPRLAVTLDPVVSLYLRTGRPAEAEGACLIQLEALENDCGIHQSRIIEGTLPGVAEVYSRLRKAEEGEVLVRKTLATLEDRLAPDHADWPTALASAGEAFLTFGHYDLAETYFERALQLRRTQFGDESLEVAHTLERIGLTCVRQAHYVESERRLVECLKIRRKLLRPDHYLVAEALGSLGFTYQRMRRYGEADETYRQGLAAAQKSAGEDAELVGRISAYWGRLDTALGRFDEAEEKLTRARAITKAALGNRSQALAFDNLFLAQLYVELRRYDEAETLARESLAIFDSVLGKDHFLAEPTVACLGEVCMATGRYREAEEFLRQSQAIVKSPKGLNRRDRTMHFDMLGLLSLKSEDFPETARHLTEARRCARSWMSEALPGLSPAEQLFYLAMEEKLALARSLSIALDNSTHQELIDASAEWLLNGKALGNEFLAREVRLARDSEDPRVAEVLRRLREVREELSRSVLRPGPRAALDAPERLSLRQRERDLARELGQLIHEPSAADPWIELEVLRAALPSDAVLIDVAKFPILRRFAEDADKAFEPPRYVAWVVPPARRGEVQMVDLGDAQAIDRAVAGAREVVQSSVQSDTDLGTVAEESRQKCAELGALVWEPLRDAAGEAQAVLVSPDGALGLFPWEAFPIDRGRYLVEDRRVSYLVSGRQVLASPGKGVAGDAWIFADPDYDLQLPPSGGEETSLWSYLLEKLLRQRPAALLGDATFDRLPENGMDVDAVASALEQHLNVAPKVYRDKNALESAFKEVRRPRILVLSTHGFFLTDQVFDGLPLTEEAEEIWAAFNAWRFQGPGRGKVQFVPDPLMRCGLALAGANQHRSAVGADDGILTGLEILDSDLRGTELVVLNACETGVGAVRYAEGTAGLHHAFQLAGAQTVVSTLWGVPAKESGQLMVAFFEEMASGQGKAAALGRAQRRLIEDLRKTEGSAHPGYWAAFTLTGDWR